MWLLGGAALEAAGLVAGVPLSDYLRRLAGLEPKCRHQYFGRTAILALLLWLAAHLGWGVAGVWRRHR